MNAPLPVFLTAYDPTELPGGTVDPLGFTAGYLALADAIFPGMTAAAGQATYFPMLCAGLAMAGGDNLTGASASAARKRRIEVGLRLERLWALASALQVEEPDDSETEEPEEDSRVVGLRGISYARREAERLTKSGAKEVETEFPLLAQQYTYGVFGIYSVVAEQLRLLERSTFAPTVGFGEAIGTSFLESTLAAPQRKELVRACLAKDQTVPLRTLKAWGARAHPGALLHGAERSLLTEAVEHDGRRKRTFEVVRQIAAGPRDDWSDRALLTACAEVLSDPNDAQLRAALEAALAYDSFLRGCLLIFERTLWLCRRRGDAAKAVTVFADPVLQAVCSELPTFANGFLVKAERLRTLGNRELDARGRGVLQEAERLVQASGTATLVRAVLRRHTQIQSAKFEQDRPKQAWIVERGDDFVLTSGRIGVRAGEPKTTDGVRAPNWRFGAALSFLSVTGQLSLRAET